MGGNTHCGKLIGSCSREPFKNKEMERALKKKSLDIKIIFIQKIRKKKLLSESTDLVFHLYLQRRVNHPRRSGGVPAPLRHSLRGLGVFPWPFSRGCQGAAAEQTSFLIFHQRVKRTWRWPHGVWVSREPVVRGGGLNREAHSEA